MDSYAALALISNPKEKYEAYRKTLIEKIEDDCSSYEASLFPFFAHLTAENANSSILAISRQLLTELGTTIPLPAAHIETILSNCLTQAHKRIVSFEEAIAAMRERLAKHYQEEGEWLKAATCLTLIPLDSGHRLVTDQYKIKTLLDIAYLYLEVEDFVSAESFMNRASVLLGKAGTQADPISQLRQKAAFVRILDFKRKFIEASSKYLELSHLSPDDDDKLHSLNQAIICAILATAGNQRSRQLAVLYKDERSLKLPIYGILEKIYQESLIKAPLIREFAKELKEHHLALLADGTTVLERSMLEHNFQAVSKIYENIYINELARLLNIAEEKAEDMAARMIEENRVPGYIDRIEGLIYFSTDDSVIQDWDARIKHACQDLELFFSSSSLPAQ